MSHAASKTIFGHFIVISWCGAIYDVVAYIVVAVIVVAVIVVVDIGCFVLSRKLSLSAASLRTNCLCC